jgi:hypothetical protein
MKIYVWNPFMWYEYVKGLVDAQIAIRYHFLSLQ